MSDEKSVVCSLRFYEKAFEEVELRFDDLHCWCFFNGLVLVSITSSLFRNLGRLLKSATLGAASSNYSFGMTTGS